MWFWEGGQQVAARFLAFFWEGIAWDIGENTFGSDRTPIELHSFAGLFVCLLEHELHVIRQHKQSLKFSNYYYYYILFTSPPVIKKERFLLVPESPNHSKHSCTDPIFYI